MHPGIQLEEWDFPALELEVRFSRGETIHTENSYKYTAARVQDLVARAGFEVTRTWTDEREWFGVYLASAV